MKQKTISVRFFLIKNRTLKNGEAPILMRITLDGEYEEIRIQRSVHPDLWNQATGLSSGKDRKAKELNEYIRTLHTKALDIHKELTMEGAYITPSLLLKKLFNNDEQRMLLDTFRQHNDELRQLVGIDYSSVTINRYLLA